MASAGVEHPAPIVIGGTYFAGSNSGYLVKVLDVHETTSSRPSMMSGCQSTK